MAIILYLVLDLVYLAMPPWSCHPGYTLPGMTVSGSDVTAAAW